MWNLCCPCLKYLNFYELCIYVCIWGRLLLCDIIQLLKVNSIQKYGMLLSERLDTFGPVWLYVFQWQLCINCSISGSVLHVFLFINRDINKVVMRNNYVCIMCFCEANIQKLSWDTCLTYMRPWVQTPAIWKQWQWYCFCFKLNLCLNVYRLK